MNKPFIVADIHAWLKQVAEGEITYSKMVELMNERAVQFKESDSTHNKLEAMFGKIEKSEWIEEAKQRKRNSSTGEIPY